MVWHVGAGVERGVYHQKENAPCQDFAAYTKLPDQSVVIAAIADGAGTASLGGRGAQLAVTYSLDFLRSRVQHQPQEGMQKTWHCLLHDLKELLEKEALAQKCDVKDFATTLLVLIAFPERLYTLQVGDGFMVVESEDETLKLWSDIAPEEYVNETTFITDDSVQPVLKDYEGPVGFWAISTDGLDPVAIDTKTHTPYPGFFNPFRIYLKSTAGTENIDLEMQGFIKSPQLKERVKDDVSLIVGSWIDS